MNMMNRQPPQSRAQTSPRAPTAPTASGTRPSAPAQAGARPVPGSARPGQPQQQSQRVPLNGGARGNASTPLTGKALSAKADELFMVMRQLCELLTKENAALKRYRADDVKLFAERKEQLANLYQAHMTAMSRDQAALKGLDTAKRTSLIQIAARLADLMRDNASMLRANIRSIDTFFQAVTDAVRDHAEQKSASYSRAGLLNGYASVRRNLAVSYNATT